MPAPHQSPLNPEVVAEDVQQLLYFRACIIFRVLGSDPLTSIACMIIRSSARGNASLHQRSEGLTQIKQVEAPAPRQSISSHFHNRSSAMTEAGRSRRSYKHPQQAITQDRATCRRQPRVAPRGNVIGWEIAGLHAFTKIDGRTVVRECVGGAR